MTKEILSFEHTDDSNTIFGNGYDGYSQSKNAIQAKKEGKFPASVAAKILKVSAKRIKNILEICEKHHTSKFYNKTNFYDIRPYYYLLNNDEKMFKKFLNDVEEEEYEEDYRNNFKELYKKVPKIKWKTVNGKKYCIDKDHNGEMFIWVKWGNEVYPYARIDDDNPKIKELYNKIKEQ